MSYILDALRRADSERERGGVPSLHAKPVPDIATDDDNDPHDRRSQPLLWAVVALSVVLVGVLAWQFMGSRDAKEPSPVAVAIPAPSPAAPAPMPVVTAPAPPPMASPPAPPPMAESPPAVATAPQPVPRKGAPAAGTGIPRAAAPKKAPTTAVVEPEGPVHTANELPENIRRELPQLAVGGAMYSENAASRMLILNGQVFHEGEKVSADLVLEQIKLKTAVLSYKGYRYGISY